MKTLAKLAMGAALAGGLAVAAAAPAEAGVHIGIGIGIPGPGPFYPDRGWCYYHPGACGYYGGYYHPYYDGYFVAGRGYWWHGGWYGHRGWGHGGWHYRR
jgi:hypothetical protein